MGRWNLRKSDQEGLTKRLLIGTGRDGGWAGACGKMDPMLARRKGTTQEWEWYYRGNPEEVDESKPEMILEAQTLEA
jgi:hypothetical protein